MEFPTTEGKFVSIEFGRFRVFGDSLVEHPASFDEPRPFTNPRPWAITRPWSAGVDSSPLSTAITGIRSKRGSASGSQPYEVYWK